MYDISQSQRQGDVTYTDNLSTTYLACHRLRTIDPLVNKKSYVYFAFRIQSVFSYSLSLILWLVSILFHKGTRNNYVSLTLEGYKDIRSVKRIVYKY